MAAIRGATGSSARAQSGSMISDKSRPGTEATLGHSADAATVKIDRATPGRTRGCRDRDEVRRQRAHLLGPADGDHRAGNPGLLTTAPA